MVEVLAPDGLGLGVVLESYISLADGLPVDVHLVGEVPLELHLAEVVVVLVLQVVLGEHLDRRLALVWLHIYYVVILLLFLEHFPVRYEPVQGFQRVCTHVRQLRRGFVSTILPLRWVFTCSTGAGASLEDGLPTSLEDGFCGSMMLLERRVWDWYICPTFRCM